ITVCQRSINRVCVDGSFLRLAFLLAVMASDYERFVVYQSRMGQAGLLAFWHRTIRFNLSRHHSYGFVGNFRETILPFLEDKCFMAAFIGLEHGVKASGGFKDGGAASTEGKGGGSMVAVVVETCTTACELEGRDNHVTEVADAGHTEAYGHGSVAVAENCSRTEGVPRESVVKV
ncbi:hypothetical protein BHE74_00038328, partial [Ensete ventricosum]